MGTWTLGTLLRVCSSWLQEKQDPATAAWTSDARWCFRIWERFEPYDTLYTIILLTKGSKPEA